MKMTTKTIRSFMTSIAVNAETGNRVRIQIAHHKEKMTLSLTAGEAWDLARTLGAYSIIASTKRSRK